MKTMNGTRMKGNWFLCTLTVAENNNNKKNENKQKYKFHK